MSTPEPVVATPPTTIDLKDYRQPVVTSLGIIIGFVLGLLGQWVTEDSFSIAGLADAVTFFGSILGILLLFTALFSMLAPIAPGEHALRHYRRILRLYGAGVLIPLLSIVLSAFL